MNFFKSPCLALFIAAFAKAVDHHLHVLHKVALRQVHFRRYYIIQADGAVAFGAYKMYMIVVVVAFGAVFAKRIQHAVFRGGYGMDHAFFHKGLQGAVHRYPVEFFAGFTLNIAVRQRIGRVQEKRQDLLPAFCNA
jgi:hypothetical protein